VSDRARLLLADDHPTFRRGLRMTLASAADQFEVVGEAATGAEAVTKAAELQPDVVIMDLNMPNLNGIEATREIVTASPHIRVLVLTMFEDDDSVFAAMRAGAIGYVLKDSDERHILRAVEAAVAGEAVFSAAIARRITHFFAAARGDGRLAPFPELTDRERELLELLADGLNNADIARRLYLSVKTVRNHVSNIFTKLQVADRAQAIVRAREAGLGSASRSTSPRDGAH
jgi:DNA-binding NarL/FixJ family response regulator